MANITIKDIATALGVSRNTVSKVINGKGGVLPDTAKRIIETATSMGYTKIGIDAQRQAGITPEAQEIHKGYIAVVASEPENYFWMGIINGVSRALSNSSYSLLYCNLSNEQIKNGTLPASILQDSVDGIIVANVYHPAILESISKRSIPKVYFDRPVDMSIESLAGDVVLSEGRTYIQEIVGMLAARGKKRIGFIGDIRTALSIQERWQGFREGMEANGLEILPEFCFTEDPIHHYYSDPSVLRILRRMADPPDAFVCANDSIAMRVLKFLTSSGLDVPGRVAVTGFDSIPESLLAKPHLTSVRIDNDAIGRRLARQMLCRLEHPDDAFETVRVSAVVLDREST